MLQKLGIQIWVDGGWGVDALLGEETRIHKESLTRNQRGTSADFRMSLITASGVAPSSSASARKVSR